MELTNSKRLFAIMIKRRSFIRAMLLVCSFALALVTAASLVKSNRLAPTEDVTESASVQHHQIVQIDRTVKEILGQIPAASKSQKLRQQDFDEIKSSLPKQSNSSARCSAPDLPLYSKFIRENRPAVIPADLCAMRGSPNWLRVSQSRVHLLSKYEAANCSAEPVVRQDDQTSRFGSAQPISNGGELPSLGFRASCKSPDGRKHSSVYYGTRRLQQLPTVQPGEPKRDNIIVLGLDSLSRLESLRSLVNASRLLDTRLKALSLLQYNIMGDGTPAALVPILTGAREQEMPEARKGFKGARHLDETMRFIFHKLRDLGYLTLYGEEGNSFGTFQLRFLGFKNEPADFYLRPVLLKQEAVQTQSICIGDEVAAGRMLSAVKDMFTMYPDRPKFAFNFFATLSHESKDLTPMDSELTKFLNWFVRENLINNTTLILMSDHGQRLGPLRNSMQGKLEESLPLMTFALSKQLEARLPRARQTLQTNQNRLTAPTDIHQTLLSIAGATRANTSSSKYSSYSLIDEAVPESRSCSDAGIPAHWCSCLSMTKMESPENQQLAVRAAQFAVTQINLATAGFRNVCTELRLDGISEADVGLASLQLSQRERRTDAAFAYNVEIKSLVSSGYITTRFSTAPNAGLYEATLHFALHNNSAVGKAGFALNFAVIGGISRTNRYGSAANCIANKMPSLRKFCFCKTQL